MHLHIPKCPEPRTASKCLAYLYSKRRWLLFSYKQKMKASFILALLETSVLGPRRQTSRWDSNSSPRGRAPDARTRPAPPGRSAFPAALGRPQERRARRGSEEAGARGVTKPNRNAEAGAEVEGTPGEPTGEPPSWGGRRAPTCPRSASHPPAAIRAAASRQLAHRKASWESRQAPEGRAGARRRRGYKREGAGGGRKWAVQLLPALLFGVWASGGAYSGGLPVQASVTGPLAPCPPPASRLRVRSRPPRPAGPTWRKRCRNT